MIKLEPYLTGSKDRNYVIVKRVTLEEDWKVKSETLCVMPMDVFEKEEFMLDLINGYPVTLEVELKVV